MADRSVPTVILGAMVVGTGINAFEAATAPSAPREGTPPGVPRMVVAGVLGTAMLFMLAEWAPNIAKGLAMLFLLSSLIIPNVPGGRAPLIQRVARVFAP